MKQYAKLKVIHKAVVSNGVDIEGYITDEFIDQMSDAIVYGIKRNNLGEIDSLITCYDYDWIHENYSEYFVVNKMFDLMESFPLDYDGDHVDVLDVQFTEPPKEPPHHIPMAISIKTPNTFHVIIGDLTDEFPDYTHTRDGKEFHVYGIGRGLDEIRTLYVTRNKEHEKRFREYFVTTNDVLKFFELDDDSILAVPIENHTYVKGNDIAETWHSEGTYYITDVQLHPMRENIFDRELFTKIFNEYIQKDDKVFEAFENAVNNAETVGDFKLWMEDEEVYILHVPSGTIIGWYKLYHIGRANFCNKYLFLPTYRDFFQLLRNQLLKEADEPEEDHVPEVTVTETDQSEYKPGPDIASAYPTKIMLNSIYGMTASDDKVCSICGQFKSTFKTFNMNGICSSICSDCIQKIVSEYKEGEMTDEKV